MDTSGMQKHHGRGRGGGDQPDAYPLLTATLPGGRNRMHEPRNTRKNWGRTPINVPIFFRPIWGLTG
jgi:hypothetical protein